MSQDKPCKSATAEQLVTILVGRYVSDNYYSAIDWNAIINLARENGVSQMLHTALLKQKITPPGPIAERIRSIHHSGVIDGAKRHHQFEKILDLLTNEGVAVIPLKGVWLSETVYPNIAMRGMADIDLWIRKDDVNRACEVMETIGYKEHANANRPRELQDAMLGEILLCKKEAPYVELHWGIFLGEWLRQTSRIDECAIRERSIPWKGEMVRQLQPEDAVIHIAVHLAVNHHMSDSVLRTLCDLMMMKRSVTIDWNLVMDRAAKWRVALPVWIVCDSMIRLFGDDDSALSSALYSIRPSAVRRAFLSRFFSPEKSVMGEKITGVKKFVFLMLLVERPGVALHLARQAIWPDRTWFSLRYGLTSAPAWRRLVQRIDHIFHFIIHRKL